MMDEHIRMELSTVRSNCTQPILSAWTIRNLSLAFETEEPADFLDLVQELRETKASSFTLRDTPMFTCRQRTIEECLAAIG